jgi:hypothetical protein
MKFMAIPHYAYMVLKMPEPHGVISIRGDINRSYDYVTPYFLKRIEFY